MSTLFGKEKQDGMQDAMDSVLFFCCFSPDLFILTPYFKKTY